MPVFMLKQVLPQKEFLKWVKYFSNPYPDATEIQLARLTLMVAQGLGAKDVKFADFLVNNFDDDKPKTEQQNEIGMSNEAVRNALSAIAIPLPSGK